MKKICIIFALGILTGSNAQFKEVDLRMYEKRLISQNGEDGVLEKIFKLIGTTNKYYVDFGAGDGHLWSNTKYLKEQFGWTGLLMDGSYPDDPSINLHREFITAENVCTLFNKYNVPRECDLVSIDIDRNDFYVWKVLCREYRPRVVVIEFNKYFNHNEDKVVIYDAHKTWNGTEYSGASILAMLNLARVLGYSLVYQESEGVNLFFVRDDVLESTSVKFKNVNNVAKIYNAKPGFPHPNRTGEVFISSLQALKVHSFKK